MADKIIKVPKVDLKSPMISGKAKASKAITAVKNFFKK